MAILTKEQISYLQKMRKGKVMTDEQDKELSMISRQAFGERLNAQAHRLLIQGGFFTTQQNVVWTIKAQNNCLVVTKFVRSNLLGFTRVFEWFFVDASTGIKVSIRAVKIDDFESKDSAPYALEKEAKSVQCLLQQRKTTVFAFLLKALA